MFLNVRIIKWYLKSLLLSPFKLKDFKSVETYCMFIGYGRSGHSLIAAILDAHPNIVISMELDALKLIKYGFSKNQLYYCIIKNSKKFQKKGSYLSGYNYHIVGQSQGNYKIIKVIGDKKGGKSTKRIDEDMEILNKLKNKVNVKIKFIHVIRNPFDNISTMINRSYNKQDKSEIKNILSKIEIYFKRVETNNNLLNNNLDIINVYYEELVLKPVETINKIFSFLNIHISDSFLKDCIEIIYKEPNRTRYSINWTDDMLKEIQLKSQKYSFLKRYSFND